MDVRSGCTTQARVQQKLTQNKQVYSVRAVARLKYRKFFQKTEFGIIAENSLFQFENKIDAIISVLLINELSKI
jgi:hypothetical protein